MKILLPTNMINYLFLASVLSGALAASLTAMSTPMIGSSIIIPTTTPSPVANVSAAEYTITALPAVVSQAHCVWNCLIPIGLADPSNCDDVTNQCACLNAPVDAMSVISGCIATVCNSSTSSYASIATSLYQSYCVSLFGASQFTSAETANILADAQTTTSSSSTPSASAKTSGVSKNWSPFMSIAGLAVIGGALIAILF
jgi:hypothetical protein